MISSSPSLPQFLVAKGYLCKECNQAYDKVNPKKNPTLLSCHQHDVCMDCFEKLRLNQKNCPGCSEPLTFSANPKPNNQTLNAMDLVSELWLELYGAQKDPIQSTVPIQKPVPVPRDFRYGVIKKSFGDGNIFISQKEVIDYLCSTELPIVYGESSGEEIKGTIVQYASLYPSERNIFFTLFIKTAESDEVKMIDWRYIKLLTWDINDNNRPTNGIKKFVADAIQYPEKPGSLAALRKQLPDLDSFGDILDTLDYTFKTQIICRMISEMLRSGNLEEARELYTSMESEKISPFSSRTSFDFSLAILSLVKAGIFTKPLPPEMRGEHTRMGHGEVVTYAPSLQEVDYERGFGYAIRETQPDRLKADKEMGSISDADIARLQAIRRDPAVQQLCRDLKFDEFFNLN